MMRIWRAWSRVPVFCRCAHRQKSVELWLWLRLQRVVILPAKLVGRGLSKLVGILPDNIIAERADNGADRDPSHKARGYPSVDSGHEIIHSPMHRSPVTHAMLRRL